MELFEVNIEVGNLLQLEEKIWVLSDVASDWVKLLNSLPLGDVNISASFCLHPGNVSNQRNMWTFLCVEELLVDVGPMSNISSILHL